MSSAPQPAKALFDPYRLLREDVTEPPRSVAAILRRIGPGMILAASIVRDSRGKKGKRKRSAW